MRYLGLKSCNMGVAFVAAYMLVLQGLLGAFAFAAASPVQLDAFGNPLCITAPDTAVADIDQGRHTAMPDCCTVACGMFAPATAGDRSSNTLANPLVPAAAAPRPAFELAGRSFALERGPGSPRSPPRAA